MHLVLVDDEPVILDLLAAACAADRHSVETFICSHEALQYLSAHPADILVTDIVMPPPDGFRLVSAATKLQPDLTAILMTGYSSQYSLEDVLACGATDLLFKPLHLQEFRARVRLAEERVKLPRAECRFKAPLLPVVRVDEDESSPEAEARRALRAVLQRAG
ncbi:MAG TPA: response regulator [Vicinamibacterales bacterium]|jgi:DNA-binding NtrC family response regulator